MTYEVSESRTFEIHELKTVIFFFLILVTPSLKEVLIPGDKAGLGINSVAKKSVICGDISRNLIVFISLVTFVNSRIFE